MSQIVYSEKYRFVIGKLRKARSESRLTQTEVAQRLKRPQSYISKIELGERRIDIAELSQLAKIYKKPISFFVD